MSRDTATRRAQCTGTGREHTDDAITQPAAHADNADPVAELKAELDGYLAMPLPGGPVEVDVPGGDLNAAAEANRQRIVLGVYLKAKEAGLDHAAAVDLTVEFMRALNAHIDAVYAAALVRGEAD